ncbi:uncharacterized protein F4812DRAFT_459768 [Daldinia caldariorum]|uniref:uncharacterized protein n=1 Tax=Daldinia caldariorum TaxID=326644 RepID=UPI002007F49A|nr:uncharacterized protein F4812DRAFT_459768 [Daldinia caldariorum]KAI1467664.1 hypothetical protein F4812DRAFT_459768 [Daldinia caldariorum]
MLSPTEFLSLLLLLPTLASAQAGFVAFKEKTCSERLDIWADGQLIDGGKLIIDHALRERGDFNGGHNYDNITFPGAQATGDWEKDTGTQFVYWKVQQPDPTCQFILLRNTQRGWESLSQLPGDELLRVSDEGCYYTAVNPNIDLITSFCCGRDDCSIAEIEVQYPSPEDTPNDKAPSCTVKSYDATPTVEDGVQIAVTRPQTCEAPPACTHSITQSKMVGTAVSHFQSFSWTTEEGVDVKIDAGIEFIVESKFSAGINFNIAQSWMDETGTTLTETNITASSEGERQQVGTVAFYAFTPQYDCWKGEVSCGKDQAGNEVVIRDVNFCQPRISSTGDSAGLFRMVYISG